MNYKDIRIESYPVKDPVERVTLQKLGFSGGRIQSDRGESLRAVRVLDEDGRQVFRNAEEGEWYFDHDGARQAPGPGKQWGNDMILKLVRVVTYKHEVIQEVITNV